MGLPATRRSYGTSEREHSASPAAATEQTPPELALRTKKLLPLSARRPLSPSSNCRSSPTLPQCSTPPANGISSLSDHPLPEVSTFPQNGFSGITAPRTGAALHAFTLRRSPPLSVFQSNTLLSMYAKFGKLESAYEVFAAMPARNPSSWNAIISAFVRAGLFQEALGAFADMRADGVGITAFVLASVVTGCDRAGWMVAEGRQLHGLVKKIGLGDDVYVGTTLVHFYGTYGLVPEASSCFEEMPERNVVSWTALMVTFSKNGHAVEAIRAYQRMKREGVVCNQNSFATVVTSCGLLKSELLSLQVLSHVVVSGFELEVTVGNSLIALFGDLDQLEYAKRVFSRMKERDVISWNSMISVYSRCGTCGESMSCFLDMLQSGVKPDSSTMSSLVSACGCLDYLNLGKTLHAFINKYGLSLSISVCNALVVMYSNCGRFEDAKLMFQDIPVKDLISWNTMISSYVESGQSTDALELLSQLLHTKVEVNHVTLTSALGACSIPEYLSDGKAVHAIIVRLGFQENLMLGNALITMYCHSNSTTQARRILEIMANKDIVTWNALIGGHAENEESKEAVEVFNMMRVSGLKANYITIMNVLGACSTAGDLSNHGRSLHAYIISSSFDSDGFIKNSLLAMYARCGDFKSSQYIFDNFNFRNVISWNAIIAAKSHHGQGEDALKLFKEMHCIGLDLDQFSLSGGLAACASLASVEEGQQLHSLTIKLGLHSDINVNNAAMDMYGKVGKMDDALKILPEKSTCTRQAWNILISGYARRGSFLQAKKTFEEMLQKGPTPDHVTFVSLLSACNHAGLVYEGLNYFSFMTSQLGISPTSEHCVCMVDLLGRSGRLTEAEKFLKDMPIPPNDVIWRSLLGSSRIHGNMEVGMKAAERLLEIDPLDDSAYVLLSNVCATNSRWRDAEHVRTHMKSISLKKKPACSWIKVKNKVISFGMGDQSLPQSEQIFAKLKDILQMVKAVGYVPDTTFALHDTDEEQKEQNLWNHSEKLALAFGLLNLPEGSSVRVFKNLRVCGDCHLVYKLASGIVGRELVLRDPYRFHHFSGGECSCSDYW